MTEKTSVHHLRQENYFSEGLEPRGGQTVVANDLDETLANVTLKGLNIVEFGVAECHNDDNYNKKLGRELAASRLKGHSMALVDFRNDQGKCTYRFENMEFKITIVQGAGRPRVTKIIVR